MADLFGGILSGGSFAGSPGECFSNNSLIVAMDVERFAPLETVKAEVSKMTERMKDTPLAEGSQGILYPGEKEVTTRLERRAKGVNIENATWEQVMTLIREYALEGTVGPLP
jgi:LDH2 family malate/lactate/ureidoglycolate dehydrogenase